MFFKPETESTMIDARSLASQGFPSGTVVAAGYQFAGRGRFPERKWEAGSGESLLFTIFFRGEDLPSSPGPLPLKAGLALSRTLEREFAIRPQIKWPNDVLVEGRKLAGILAESRGEHLFIGMGMNCLQKTFPMELKKTAVALRQVTGRKFLPLDLLPGLLRELKTWLRGEGDWKKELEERLFLKDEIITFLPGLPGNDETVLGRLVGISEEGLLLVKPEESPEPLAFASGEIRFERPKGWFGK